MIRFITLFIACLLLQKVQSLDGIDDDGDDNNDTCTRGIYKYLVSFAGDSDTAQSYCSNNYPIPATTITVLEKRHVGIVRWHPQTTTTVIVTPGPMVTTAPHTTSSITQMANVQKRKLGSRAKSLLARVCTCIGTQDTVTVQGTSTVDSDDSTTSSTTTSTNASSTDPSDPDSTSDDNNGSNTDPSDTDPSDTDPSDTDPSDTDPSSTDSSDPDPSSTDSSNTDPSSTDSSSTDPSPTDSSNTDPSSADPSSTTSTADPSSPDPTVTNLSNTDSSDTNTSVPGASGTVQPSTTLSSAQASITDSSSTTNAASLTITVTLSSASPTSSTPPDVTCDTIAKGNLGGGCPNNCYCDQSAANGPNDPGVCDNNDGDAGECSAEDPTCPDGATCIVYQGVYYCAVYSDCLPSANTKMFARDGLVRGYGYERTQKRKTTTKGYTPIDRSHGKDS